MTKLVLSVPRGGVFDPRGIRQISAQAWLLGSLLAGIKPGESYRVFKKCVSISILNFTLFPEETDFYSCFHIREDTRNFLYTDKMEFHVIELPKLPEGLQDGSNDLELWAKFIDAERKEVFDMLADKNPYIESAYQKLQVISQDKDKRLEYEAREKAIRDYNEGLLEAEERGIAIGQERGIAIGQERGIAIGQERGMERLNRLNTFLLQNKRFDDLERAARDADFQQQLMREYGI